MAIYTLRMTVSLIAQEYQRHHHVSLTKKSVTTPDTNTTINTLRSQLKTILTHCPALDVATLVKCCQMTPRTLREIFTQTSQTVHPPTQHAIQQFYAFILLFHDTWSNSSSSEIVVKWCESNCHERVHCTVLRSANVK